MRRSRIAAVVGVNVLAAMSLFVPSGVASGAGVLAPTPFVTGVRPFLVALEDGVVVQPVLTTGDIIGESG